MTVTPSDIRANFETEASDAEIQALVDFIVGEAQDCMTANSVPPATQDLLVTYAVRHMLVMQSDSGRGSVTSERAPSGSSRSFGSWSGKGLDASRYGNLLKQVDRYGCVRNVLENTGRVALLSVGPGCSRGRRRE